MSSVATRFPWLRLPIPRSSILPGESAGLPDVLAEQAGIVPPGTAAANAANSPETASDLYRKLVSRPVDLPRLRPDIAPGAYEQGGQIQSASRGRRLLGIGLASFLGGMYGPQVGQQATEQAIYGPYRRALESANQQAAYRKTRAAELEPLLAQERAQMAAPRPIPLGGGAALILDPSAPTGFRVIRTQTQEQQPSEYTLSPGQRRYRGGKLLAEVPPAEGASAAAPTKVREYQFAKANGFQGTFEEWVRQGATGAKPNFEQQSAINALRQRLGREPTAQEVESALAELRQQRLTTNEGDIKDAADAIYNGEGVPVLSQYSYRDRTAILAELHRRGFNQAEAERDWRAVQRYMSSLNGTQQLRLRQAIEFSYGSLDLVNSLFDEWKNAGLGTPLGVRPFNKATLKAYEQFGGPAGAAAQSLEANINDLVAELGVVYRGGNASTNESLRLAAQNLGADWTEAQFKKQIATLRKTLRIRKNSIVNTGAQGVQGSPYAPAQPSQETTPLPGDLSNVPTDELLRRLGR